jgi:hypothetical protein
MTNPPCNNQYMLGKDFTTCKEVRNRIDGITYEVIKDSDKVTVTHKQLSGVKSSEVVTGK